MLVKSVPTKLKNVISKFTSCSKLKAKGVPLHGHLLITEGLKPDPEKVRAIVEMSRLEGRDDILRLNGMVNYLSRFLPNLMS